MSLAAASTLSGGLQVGGAALVVRPPHRRTAFFPAATASSLAPSRAQRQAGEARQQCTGARDADNGTAHRIPPWWCRICGGWPAVHSVVCRRGRLAQRARCSGGFRHRGQFPLLVGAAIRLDQASRHDQLGGCLDRDLELDDLGTGNVEEETGGRVGGAGHEGGHIFILQRQQRRDVSARRLRQEYQRPHAGCRKFDQADPAEARARFRKTTSRTPA